MLRYKIPAAVFLFLTIFCFLAMLMDDCLAYTAYRQTANSAPYFLYILENIINYGIFFIPFGILGIYFLKKTRENQG